VKTNQYLFVSTPIFNQFRVRQQHPIRDEEPLSSGRVSPQVARVGEVSQNNRPAYRGRAVVNQLKNSVA
jgi:hypothetical protein